MKEVKQYAKNIPDFEIKYKTGTVKKKTLTSSADAADVLRQLYDSNTLEYTESFILLLLNQANKTIGWEMISKGGITGTVADPRVILKTVLLSGAVNFMVSHNHPSGNLQPSKADKELTTKLKEAASFMELKLIDHVIITAESYFSFADEGLI